MKICYTELQMIAILPSLLSNDISELSGLIDKTKSESRVHVDILDGVFAKNTTVEPQEIASLRTNSKLDFHLMVYEPVTWLQKCKEGGADRVISQVEMMVDVDAYVDVSNDLFGMVGLALDLDSEVEKIPMELLHRLDTILLMSVRAGFGGQEFNATVLEKVRYFDNLRNENGYNYSIGIDGGITPENITSVVDAGADEVSVGRRLFDGDLAGNIQKYLERAYKK